MKIVFLGANNPETIREINVQKRFDPDFEVIGFLDNDPNKIGKSFYGFEDGALSQFDYARLSDAIDNITRSSGGRRNLYEFYPPECEH